MEVPKQVCRTAWLIWIPMVWCSLVLCVVFLCLLANRRIACLGFVQGLSYVVFFPLCLWRNACSSGNWRLLFACQQPLFQDYLSCGLAWQEISLQRESSSQLQPGQAVTEFCVWSASMMEVDAPLAYGSTAGSNSCWDLNTSLFKKNND